MGILLTIFFIVLFFKLTVLFFRICGRILGIMLSLAGYALIGIFAIAILGIALKAIPLLLLIGIGATAVALAKN